MRIGIDPDVEKSGFALINGKDYELLNLTFFELFEKLKTLKKDKLKVYVECGYLNKSNWHTKRNGSAAVNAQIGQRTGANHEVAKKILEMCVYLEIEHYAIRPTARKIDSKTFQALTKIKERTNQEKRDAFMLVFGR